LFLSLADLEAFMKVARMGLTKHLKEGDYDGLVKVMGHLMKVKERQASTDSMFEPLKQTIELLKTYGEEMPEEIYLKLQAGGHRWQVPPGKGRAGSQTGGDTAVWTPAGLWIPQVLRREEEASWSTGALEAAFQSQKSPI
jgi:hypothetical protein